MKHQCRFVTVSGSTYVWSWMTVSLYKIEADGSRTHVLSDPVTMPAITVGERFVSSGRHWDEDCLRWRYGYEISTSPVVSKVSEPDHYYSLVEAT